MTLKTVITHNAFSAINDALFRADVTSPILLVKQFRRKEIWYHVPGYSHITDQHALLAWLKISAYHPLNHDQIIAPTRYHNMPTRYVWHDLAANFAPVKLPADFEVLNEKFFSLSLREASQEVAVSTVPQAFFACSTDVTRSDSNDLDDAFENKPHEDGESQSNAFS
ncbi:MAG: hypothetical protein ACRCXC_10945 [Legionella sp.]